MASVNGKANGKTATSVVKSSNTGRFTQAVERVMEENWRGRSHPMWRAPSFRKNNDRITERSGEMQKRLVANLVKTGTSAKDAARLISGSQKFWERMSSYLSTEPDDIEQFIANHAEFTLARSVYNWDERAAYLATAFTVRDRLIEFWNDTCEHFHQQNCKRVYYMSIEYLMGRTLQNAVMNLGLEDAYGKALKGLGHELETLYSEERDAALGNGGLGRLAACFLDSLATQDWPAWGYGLRYQYGMFRQLIHEGFQAEVPDFWLEERNPWELERRDVCYTVRFFGNVQVVKRGDGQDKYVWDGGQVVEAVAYDTPIPGRGTFNTINLRLWASQPSNEFDLNAFNSGDYYKALEERQATESLTSVLYPNDSTPAGKELRLKQQYFFSSATLQDIVRRFQAHNVDIHNLADKVAIQLNDTHPVIAIPEMMRLLMDVDALGWDDAWAICVKVFSYTNHTVLPEALEKWSIGLLGHLLPRLIDIIYEINRRFLTEVRMRYPGRDDIVSRMSLIDDATQSIRMAHLGIVGSHTVNGVAAIHTRLIKETIFADFYDMMPEKFQNKTNGVTPRRWVEQCNRPLADLITALTGDSEWVRNFDLVKGIEEHADDPRVQKTFDTVKREAKERLRQLILTRTQGAVDVSVDALFDIQVKRIHEYKRQLLNILYVIHRYQTIKEMSREDLAKVVPRVVIIGGKAAPAYVRAKKIIKLINSVGAVVNNDITICDKLKVVFLADYNVSLAEIIIPASDISEHISTAGTEASGTSNMKFVMNGGLIIGTLDGANVEIREEIGEENMFIFGATADEVNDIRAQGDRPIDERLFSVLRWIQEGHCGEYHLYEDIINPLFSGNDHYLLAYDFSGYVDAQRRVDAAYLDQPGWLKSSIVSVANMGKFSSDRTIEEYATQIWGIERQTVPQSNEEGTPKNSDLHRHTASPQPPRKTNESIKSKPASATRPGRGAARKDSTARRPMKESVDGNLTM